MDRSMLTARPTRPDLAWLAVAFFILLLWTPLFTARTINNAYSDWTFHVNYASFIRDALLDRGSFPYWVSSERYEHFRLTGAHLLFANPEVALLSPLTPLLFLFTFEVAVKLVFALCLLVGTYGCFRLLRSCVDEPSPVAAAFLAVMVLANGAVQSHMITGYISVMAVAILPLALALFIEALQPGVAARTRRMKLAATGVTLAMVYYAGGVHPLITFLAVTGVYVCVRAALDRDPAALRGYVVVTAWFAGLSAFKLLTTLRYLYGYRPEYLMAFSGVSEFLKTLASANAEPSPEHEFNTYIGVLGVLLTIAGLGRLRRPWWPLLASGIAALLFSTDRFARMLQHLPMLNTQGSFARFRMMFLLFVGLAAALGLDAIVKRAAVAGGRRAVVVHAISWAVVVAFSVMLPTGVLARHVRAKETMPFPEMSRVVFEALRLVPADPTVKVALGVYKAEVNEFTYRYSVARPSDVPVHLVSPKTLQPPRKVPLRCEGDAEISNVNGRMAVTLTKPQGTFSLYYDRRWAYSGLAVSVVSLIGLSAFVVGGRR